MCDFFNKMMQIQKNLRIQKQNIVFSELGMERKIDRKSDKR